MLRDLSLRAPALGPTSNLPVEVVSDSPVFRVFEPRFWQIEFGVPDLNKFAALATRRSWGSASARRSTRVCDTVMQIMRNPL